MKRFEVEFEKDTYLIVSFERSKSERMFLYEGKAHVSPYRTTDINYVPLFFSFRFSRMETGWEELEELDLKSEKDEVAINESVKEVLIKGIKEFEDVK